MKNFVLIFIVCFQSFGQESPALDSLVKTNTVIFAEMFGGIGGGGAGIATLWGVEVNYQFSESHLLTFRFSEIYVGKLGGTSLGFAGFPTFKTPENLREVALLYGKRWIYTQSSLSISGGLSYSNRCYEEYTEIETVSRLTRYSQEFEDQYLGFPFELNVKWFKSRKAPFRAYYGIIPIGKKKVAFGRSLGFKLSGNFGKTSYFGIGISYGFGFHKRY